MLGVNGGTGEVEPADRGHAGMTSKADGKPPNIIDVEASGFGPFSYPIEIGVALGGGGKYCTLVLPLPGWTHWDDDAEAVHRIPRGLLKECGKPARHVALELNGLLGDETVYTDGWVVDKPWLVRLFHEAQVEPTFRTSALEMILSEPQMEKWHETKDKVLEDLALTRHRASYDAYVIQQTWLRTKGSGRPA